jgi:hypothetical protein
LGASDDTFKIRHDDIRDQVNWSDSALGGPLPSWFFGRLLARGADGQARGKVRVWLLFKGWRGLLSQFPEGRFIKKYLATCVNRTPEPGDAERLAAAADEDERWRQGIAATRAEVEDIRTALQENRVTWPSGLTPLPARPRRRRPRWIVWGVDARADRIDRITATIRH